MTKNKQLRRLFLALMVSGAINVIGIILDSSTNSRRYPPSIPSRIVEIIFSPAGAFAEWVVPAGHDAAHILGAAAVSIVSSLIFYAIVSWVILTIWARARREGSDQDGSLSIPR